MSKPRVAVVLFNLGGPDAPEAVKPFLFNLFRDKAILTVPNPFRFFLAKLISSRRTPVAQRIYAQLGGRSPLVPLTQAQADGLKISLSDTWEVEVFPCMRYWHPMSDEVVQAVKAFAPDHIIALPLYAQYSTATTASSFRDWRRAAKKSGLEVPTSYVCCYPTEEQFIRAHAELIRPVYEAAKAHGTPRILFSAHGLPEKTVAGGDPYQWQVERTTAKVLELLQSMEEGYGKEAGSADHASLEPIAERFSPCERQNGAQRGKQINYINCYQSRVGPLKWIGPATDEEIKRGGRDGVPLVVVPVSFVSEHSETLVELDIEYGKLAAEHGVPYYGRVPALGDYPGFITSLAHICKTAYKHAGVKPAEAPQRYCREDWKQCPCAA